MNRISGIANPAPIYREIRADVLRNVYQFVYSFVLVVESPAESHAIHTLIASYCVLLKGC
jgi:hypothetical protein